jgi:nitrite reductase/ring-hydroxylating ferredoxin subunit
MARVDGTAYAVSGACTHMGCPIFAGSLAAGVITCPCQKVDSGKVWIAL